MISVHLLTTVNFLSPHVKTNAANIQNIKKSVLILFNVIIVQHLNRCMKAYIYGKQ
jgi:hypothetical protein